jgi:hypothetical protein
MATLKETLHFYIEQLNESQQQSLLAFLKAIIPSQGRVSVAQYNEELNEAESRIEKGYFTTQEALEEEIKSW